MWMSTVLKEVEERRKLSVSSPSKQMITLYLLSSLRWAFVTEVSRTFEAIFKAAIFPFTMVAYSGKSSFFFPT